MSLVEKYIKLYLPELGANVPSIIFNKVCEHSSYFIIVHIIQIEENIFVLLDTKVLFLLGVRCA